MQLVAWRLGFDGDFSDRPARFPAPNSPRGIPVHGWLKHTDYTRNNMDGAGLISPARGIIAGVYK